jgi:hypothetical protein
VGVAIGVGVGVCVGFGLDFDCGEVVLVVFRVEIRLLCNAYFIRSFRPFRYTLQSLRWIKVTMDLINALPPSISFLPRAMKSCTVRVHEEFCV